MSGSVRRALEKDLRGLNRAGLLDGRATLVASARALADAVDAAAEEKAAYKLVQCEARLSTALAALTVGQVVRPPARDDEFDTFLGGLREEADRGGGPVRDAAHP